MTQRSYEVHATQLLSDRLCDTGLTLSKIDISEMLYCIIICLNENDARIHVMYKGNPV